jgi:hypothetical protein
LDNTIIQKIQFEIEQINKLIKESTPIFDLCKVREPDFVEKCGIAMILQSFYNGIEKIMLLIVKNKDSKLPNGIKWHKELFDCTFTKTEYRTKVFGNELGESLNDYLQFRHLTRHTYGFQLTWEKMEDLLFNMNMIWDKVKEDIKIFIENN